nr:hypothetical protein Iba_chr02eCG2450 [Ipomoea batatas]
MYTIQVLLSSQQPRKQFWNPERANGKPLSKSTNSVNKMKNQRPDWVHQQQDDAYCVRYTMALSEGIAEPTRRPDVFLEQITADHETYCCSNPALSYRLRKLHGGKGGDPFEKRSAESETAELGGVFKEVVGGVLEVSEVGIDEFLAGNFIGLHSQYTSGLDIVWQMGFCNYDDEDVDGVDNWPFCGPACYQTTWKFFTGLHFRRSLLVVPSMSNQQ